MYVKRNILFFLNKKPKTDTHYLRCRIKWPGHSITFNLGFEWDSTKWNRDSQRCTRNTTNRKKESAATVNKKISEIETNVDDIFKAFEVKETIPTQKDIKKALGLRDEGSGAKSFDFFSLFDEFVKEQSNLNNWTVSTLKKLAVVKNHLEGFDKKLTFDKLDESGLSKYLLFLRSKKGHRDSTIKKQLNFLKWFLRWAKKKGYCNQLAFETFKPKLKIVNNTILFLHWDELMTVYNKEIPADKEYLDRVRDMFCFCCFTSLRHSDLKNLKKSDIYAEHITVTTVKTNDNLIIDLNDYSRAILAKYKDYRGENNEALPVISNQKMNDYLKDLARFCELNRLHTDVYFKGNERYEEVKPISELIGTHAGRRTFISNAIMLGIPPEVVMKWTGHSDYKSMKPYIEIAAQTKKESMKLFNQQKVE